MDNLHPAEWLREGSRPDGSAIDVADEVTFRPAPRMPVFPRPISYHRDILEGAGLDAAPPSIPAQVFPNFTGSDLLPMIWDGTKEHQGVGRVTMGPVQMDMDYDGKFPELLDVPMVYSNYYKALSPARYTWGRIVSYGANSERIVGETVRTGILIGAIRPQPGVPGLEFQPGERSGTLWRASGPAHKIGPNRWRVTAWPIIRPWWYAEPKLEWVRVATECYVWEPPEYLNTLSSGTVLEETPTDPSEFPPDPVIYDLWELRSAMSWLAHVGGGHESAHDISPARDWLYGNDHSDPFRVLVARGTDITLFPIPVNPVVLVWDGGGMGIFSSYQYRTPILRAVVNLMSDTIPILDHPDVRGWREFRSQASVNAYRPASEGIVGAGPFIDVAYQKTVFGSYSPLDRSTVLGANGWWGKNSQKATPGPAIWDWFHQYRIKLSTGIWDGYPVGHPAPFLNADLWSECEVSNDRPSIETIPEIEATGPPPPSPPLDTDTTNSTDNGACNGFSTWSWLPVGGGGGTADSSGDVPESDWFEVGQCDSGCISLAPGFTGDFLGQEYESDCIHAPG